MKPAALLAIFLLGAASAKAAAADRLALFDVELVNTSLEPTRPDEQARLALVRDVAAARLAAHGLTLVDTAPVAADAAKAAPLRDCNGCELDLARRLGAGYAAIAWVQKVSDLILNVNMQIRDARSGATVRGGSVDIRGNNDESWRRGIAYLIDRRMFPAAPSP